MSLSTIANIRHTRKNTQREREAKKNNGYLNYWLISHRLSMLMLINRKFHGVETLFFHFFNGCAVPCFHFSIECFQISGCKCTQYAFLEKIVLQTKQFWIDTFAGKCLKIADFHRLVWGDFNFSSLWLFTWLELCKVNIRLYLKIELIFFAKYQIKRGKQCMKVIDDKWINFGNRHVLNN